MFFGQVFIIQQILTWLLLHEARHESSQQLSFELRCGFNINLFISKTEYWNEGWNQMSLQNQMFH